MTPEERIQQIMWAVFEYGNRSHTFQSFGQEPDSEPRTIARNAMLAQVECIRDLLRQLIARPEEAKGWRYVNTNELPDGVPVAPGTTLYAFTAHDAFHWEYDLPALPERAPQPRE